jgi:exodeoxyribonuclease-3
MLSLMHFDVLDYGLMPAYQKRIDDMNRHEFRSCLQLLQVICASFYHLATPALAAGAQSVEIYKGEKFSDHAPITIGYAW